MLPVVPTLIAKTLLWGLTHSFLSSANILFSDFHNCNLKLLLHLRNTITKVIFIALCLSKLLTFVLPFTSSPFSKKYNILLPCCWSNAAAATLHTWLTRLTISLCSTPRLTHLLSLAGYFIQKPHAAVAVWLHTQQQHPDQESQAYDHVVIDDIFPSTRNSTCWGWTYTLAHGGSH